MRSSSKPLLMLIAGPTASGKSELAARLAEMAGGVVINADSAQLYRGLDLISAAPKEDERKRAEHRLYGVLDPSRACSAADWANLARKEIDRAHALARTPLLVGGTGLYLRTLLDGIAPVPPVDPAVRQQVRSLEVADAYRQLEQDDPAMAQRLNPRDSSRIARALEVVRSTGRSLIDHQARREGGIGGSVDLRPLLLLPPRVWLYRRCDQRFAAMVEGGAVDEVRRLLGLGLDPGLPAMRAIGVREIAHYLAGEISIDEAIDRGQQSTRRYAKRQYTWFAHQPPQCWPRFLDPLDDDAAFRRALALVGASA